jgi:predicted negative regulator of RcsB-dependent stress response
MEWIRDNWIPVLFVALLIVVYFFGYRVRQGRDREGHDHGEHPDEKADKKGHGCCQ